MEDFDLNKTIPIAEEEGQMIRSTPFVDDFDLNQTRPVIIEPIGEMLKRNLKKAGVETLKETGRVLSVLRWPFWRFIEQPVSTVATALQESEGKTVGGTLGRAFQGYVPFRKIPVEEYGNYGQIWRNYYKSVVNAEPPNWYIAMASYGTAVGVEVPAIRVAEKGTELALTRVARPDEAQIIRKAFEPLKAKLEQGGLDTAKLHPEGNIIRLSEESELYINKYLSAVLRGDQVRIPRWAKIDKLPVPFSEAGQAGEAIVPLSPEVLPVTGKEIILPLPSTSRMPQKQSEVTKETGKLGRIKSIIAPEKIKPDISGVARLQRQIQAMEIRQERVDILNEAIIQADTVLDYYKFAVKENPDSVIEELNNTFGTSLKTDTDLNEYIENIKAVKKSIQERLKEEAPQLIAKRETALLNQRIKATEQGLKEGRIQTKEEIEAVQTELIQAIEDAKLPLDERAKFLRTIKNIQTKQDLAREFPKIAERLRETKEKQTREELVGEIKKIAERAKTSQVIAVDYADLIQKVINRFELQGHRPETVEELQKIKEYIQQAIKEGREIDMPEDVLKKLEILERKPFKEITAQELEDLRDTVEELELLGKTKLRLRQMAYERRKVEDLIKLKADSTPIIGKEKIKAGIGEKLSTSEKLKNKLTSIFNASTEKKIVLTPMDAIFDELDGQKNYKGANFTIFKKTIDKHFSNWFDLSDKHTTKVRELAKDLDETNFERIAVYATIQQEGGLEKLQSMGFTEEEVSKITLIDKEQALLDEMRKQFDATWPQVSEIMRIVYNKPFAKVKFYFPFMTDYGAMTDFEIRDRFGDVPEYTRFLKKNVEMGFTKARVGGEQKIKLNAMEVFMRHIDNATYLMTVGKDIKYLNDLAATKEYGEAVGDVGQEIVREWLDLIARKGRLAGDRVPILDALRKYTSGVYLSFKLSSALVQFTALFDGAALIGNYAFEGTQMIVHKEIRDFLKDNFPEWRKRIADDPAFLDFYEDDTILDKAIQLGISPLKLFDSLTAGSVSIGAYKKFCVENGIEFDIAKPDKNAIDYAQLILRRTQASGLFKDAPLALSKGKLSGNISVDKVLLQFQSFLLNRWSLITHDLYKAGIKGKNKKQALNIAMWIILATLAEMGMRRIVRKSIKAVKGEKDDRELASEIITTALQNMPFMGNMVSMLYYGSLGIPSIDWLNRAAEYSAAGVKSKNPEAKMRNFLKAGALLLPGGSQMTQMFPANKKASGKVR